MKKHVTSTDISLLAILVHLENMGSKYETERVSPGHKSKQFSCPSHEINNLSDQLDIDEPVLLLSYITCLPGCIGLTTDNLNPITPEASEILQP